MVSVSTKRLSLGCIPNQNTWRIHYSSKTLYGNNGIGASLTKYGHVLIWLMTAPEIPYSFIYNHLWGSAVVHGEQSVVCFLWQVGIIHHDWHWSASHDSMIDDGFGLWDFFLHKLLCHWCLCLFFFTKKYQCIYCQFDFLWMSNKKVTPPWQGTPPMPQVEGMWPSARLQELSYAKIKVNRYCTILAL